MVKTTRSSQPRTQRWDRHSTCTRLLWRCCCRTASKERRPTCARATIAPRARSTACARSTTLGYVVCTVDGRERARGCLRMRSHLFQSHPLPRQARRTPHTCSGASSFSSTCARRSCCRAIPRGLSKARSRRCASQTSPRRNWDPTPTAAAAAGVAFVAGRVAAAALSTRLLRHDSSWRDGCPRQWRTRRGRRASTTRPPRRASGRWRWWAQSASAKAVHSHGYGLPWRTRRSAHTRRRSSATARRWHRRSCTTRLSLRALLSCAAGCSPV